MHVKFEKMDGWIIFLALIGLGLFIYLYPKLYPQSSIRMDINKQEAVDLGTALIEELGYDLSQYYRTVNLDYDWNQLSYLNRVFGSSETNRLMADSVQVFYWAIRWSHEKTSSLQIGGDEEVARDRLDQIFGQIRLSIDLKGKPIRFDYRPQRNEERSSQREESSSEEKDRQIAESIMNRLRNFYRGEWNSEGSSERQRPEGRARQYTWHLNESIAGENVSIRVTSMNGRVRSFNIIYHIPEPYSEQKRGDDWNGVVAVILGLLFFILVIVYFIRRLRADLMDLKSGLIPALVVSLGYFIYFWAQISPDSGDPIWEILLGFVISAPFVGAGIWVLFSVGESITREVWVEKLIVVDTLRRKILFPALGLAILRGFALVFLGLGIISLLNYAGIHLFHGFFTLGDTHLPFWTFSWPSLYGIGSGLLSSMYIICIFCLFLIPVIRSRFRRRIWFMIILFLLWSFVSMPIPRLNPFVLRMGINGLIGLLFVYFYLRYDFVTVLTGGVGMPILFYGVTALYAGEGFFTLQGILLLGLFIVFFILALIAMKSEPPSEDIKSYVPDYLRRIYERERIQRELEIARNVQLTFLPRRNPEIKGMNIATLCLPAKEVGGDYYDFVELGPRKLGVVIGDVSGKGISAAFYMTLTKGFLKSQAQNISSPRKILINMNELFYQNSERGFFISMIYGVFDLDARTLTFARAGHNPMILRRPGKGLVEELSPPGIALGLDKGDIFSRTIEERSLGIEQNDVFLFYTDGLNEAQNQFHEEFGEDRLMRIVETYTEASAEDLLDRTQREILHFTAQAPQHDDMTAVIVKIV